MYRFDDKKHIHYLDDKRLHGVTTVLSSWGNAGALINWAANQAVDYIKNSDEVTDEVLKKARTAHVRKRNKAGDKGTQVHVELEKILNDWIEKGSPLVNKDHSECVRKVIYWMTDNAITPIATEVNVYSRTHWYGGIFDAIIEKDGKKYILDFKTSSTIQPKYFFQCGAYSLAVKEMKQNANISGVCIVHMPRGESFNKENGVYLRKDLIALERAFLNILETFKLDKDLQKITAKSIKN